MRISRQTLTNSDGKYSYIFGVNWKTRCRCFCGADLLPSSHGNSPTKIHGSIQLSGTSPGSFTCRERRAHARSSDQKAEVIGTRDSERRLLLEIASLFNVNVQMVRRTGVIELLLQIVLISTPARQCLGVESFCRTMR